MVFLFVGSPLSGKSTLSKKLAKDLNIYRFATGDFAREMGMNPLENSIKEKDLSTNLNDVINSKVIEMIRENEDILIDGFPRSEEQIVLLNNLSVDFVVFFLYASPATVFNRLTKRNRAGDENIDFVIGRINSALMLKLELSKKCKNFITYTVGDELDTNYNNIKQYMEQILEIQKINRSSN